MAGQKPVPIEEHLRRRSGVSQPQGLYQRVTGAVTNAASGLVQGAINAGTAQSAPGQIPMRDMMPATTPTSDAVARFAVPQTPVQLGIAAGTMGAGGLAARTGMAGLSAAATRVAGGAAGGELGGLAEGLPVGEGAIEGGASALLGESFGWGVGKILRSRGGARAQINTSEWDKMADEVSKYVPGLFKAKTPAELKRKLLSGEIQDELGNRYAASLDDVKTLIGGNDIFAPSIYDASPLPLEDLVKKLSEVGHAGFGGSKSIPIRRTIAGKTQRTTWEEGLEEIKAQLDRFNPTGEAKALFEKARNEYAVGKTLEDILRQPGTWHGGPKTVEVDFNRLREAYEQQLSKFRNMLTPADLAAVEKVLYRGGPFGGRDLLPSGFGGMEDAAGQLMRQGGGTGTVGVMLPRTLLPNAGAQYTGQPPFSLPAAGQTGLDALINPLWRSLGAPGLPEK